MFKPLAKGRLVFFTCWLEDFFKRTLSFLNDCKNLSKVFLKILLIFSLFQTLFSFFLPRRLKIFNLLDHFCNHLKLFFVEVLVINLLAFISDYMHCFRSLILIFCLKFIKRACILFFFIDFRFWFGFLILSCRSRLRVLLHILVWYQA